MLFICEWSLNIYKSMTTRHIPIVLVRFKHNNGYSISSLVND